MKCFIIILLACLPLAGMACGPFDPVYNYYMLKVNCDNNPTLQESRNEEIAKYWSAYVGRPITTDNVFQLLELTTDDLDNTDNPIVKFAREEGDEEMQDYLYTLVNYLSHLVEFDNWVYPTEEEFQENEEALAQTLKQCREYEGGRLMPQYLLLQARVLTRTADYKGIVHLWKQCHNQLEESVFKSMFQGYYAGALFHLGNMEEACAQYAEIGDEESALYCIRHHRNIEYISAMYEKNPQSRVLPFIIEDFVNSVQQTKDDIRQGYLGDEIAISYNNRSFIALPVTDREVEKFLKLAARVKKERKSDCLMYWSTATAMLHYLYGELDEAQRDINEALRQKGTSAMRDNALAVRLLIRIEANKDGHDDDRFILTELMWLNSKVDKVTNNWGYTSNNHWGNVQERILHNALIPLCQRQGKPHRELAIRAFLEKEEVGEFYTYERCDSTIYSRNLTYGTHYFQALDTIALPILQEYYTYLHGELPQHNALDKWFTQQIYKEDVFLEDLIGTRLMRQGRFEEALQWLYRVPLAFVSKQNIAPYMIMRSYGYAPWLTKQPSVDEEDTYIHIAPLENKKINFCRDILSLQRNYKNAKTNRDKTHWAYNLAVYYAQASTLGQCWWLVNYGTTYNMKLHPGDVDFATEAHRMLAEAEASPYRSVTESTIYGRAWLTYKTHGADALLMQDYHNLAMYADTTIVSDYISNCNILRRLGKPQTD